MFDHWKGIDLNFANLVRNPWSFPHVLEDLEGCRLWRHRETHRGGDREATGHHLLNLGNCLGMGAVQWHQVGTARDPEVIGELYNLHHGATFGSLAQTWAEVLYFLGL